MALLRRFNCGFLLVVLFTLSIRIDVTSAAKITKPITNAGNSKTALALVPIEEQEKADEADSDQGQEDEVDEETSVAEAATTASDTTPLRMWSVLRSVWSWLRDDLSESLLGEDSRSATAAGRTFGKIRRLQMALIPIIFKFGVLSAMVAFLVMVSLKTFFLVKLLVLMNAVAILAKFLTLKTNLGHSLEHSAAPPSWGYSNWSPANVPSHGWSSSSEQAVPHPSKEIHLHIHGAQGQPQVSAYSSYGQGQKSYGWESRNDPYTAYDQRSPISYVEAENELTPLAPIAVMSTKYPTNHKTY